MKTQEKGLLLIYLRKLIPLSDVQIDFILSYRHDMSNLYISCNFLELIEIPIYENDSFCEFKADIYLENETFSLTQKIIFEEFGLNTNEIKTFSMNFNSKNQRFFLIFDAFFKSSLTGNKISNNNIMKLKVQEVKNLPKFMKKREMVNREKHILKKNISDYKYFLEFRYFEQKFALELSQEETQNLNLREFFFIYDKNELSHPFTIEVNIAIFIIFYLVLS